MDAPQYLSHYLAPFALDLVRLCVWLVLLIVIFVPMERFFGLHPQKFLRKAFGTDLVYYFLSSLVPKLVLILPLTLVAAVLHHLVPSGLYGAIAAMPLLIRLSAAMIVSEVGAYWGHRWSHEIPLLWRFHAIHHSAEELDWLVNVRAHPVDLVVTRLCGLLPLYLLGLAQPMGETFDLVPVLITLAGTFWGFFIHANVRLRLGWLERLVACPAFHHWHHTNDGPDRINKNYAAMLPWVDRCFGTFYLPEQQWPGRYGVDVPIASGVAEQLLAPFLPEPKSVESE